MKDIPEEIQKAIKERDRLYAEWQAKLEESKKIEKAHMERGQVVRQCILINELWRERAKKLRQPTISHCQ